MKGQLDQAVRVLSELHQAEPSVRDPQIAALKQAKGIVFMTQIKAGFFVSATAASGFIISRTPDGSWSAPSSLGAAGLGMGLQAGAQSTDIIIALSTDDAVERLMNSGRLSFGGEAEFTVPDGLPGPSHVGESNIGPAVGGNNGGFRAYSRAHGVFGGISIDGMALLTRDGDLAHALFEVEYLVVDAVKFLETTSPAKADQLVTAILKQAAVEAASTLTLAEFTETRDALGPAVRERAQRSLDKLETGIEISVVRANARSAPYAVQNRFREVQTAREGAKGSVERARQEAVTTLTQIAGGEVYLELLALIREYEQSLASGRAQDAEAVLARLGARMEARDIGGEISLTILRAKSAESSLRSRLESEVKRLDSLAASFRESGASVVQQLWLDAVREVLENPQAEVFAAPSAIGLFSLHMTSSSEIMQARRDSEIARNKAMSAARQAGSFYSPNSEQIMIGRPGRRLKRDASGGDGRF